LSVILGLIAFSKLRRFGWLHCFGVDAVEVGEDGNAALVVTKDKKIQVKNYQN
jgi:hypothetical protein